MPHRPLRLSRVNRTDVVENDDPIALDPRDIRMVMRSGDGCSWLMLSGKDRGVAVRGTVEEVTAAWHDALVGQDFELAVEWEETDKVRGQ